MNKILTRIATAFVGIAMAVGVGVAVGNNTNFVKASANNSISFNDLVTLTGYSGGSELNNLTATSSGVTFTFEAITGSDGQKVQVKKATSVSSTAFPGVVKGLTVYGCSHGSSKSDGGFTVYGSTNGSTWSSALWSKLDMAKDHGDQAVDLSSNTTYTYIKLTISSNRVLKFNRIDVSYSDGSGPTTYTVTYNGTNKTSGSVPTDSNAYEANEVATVLGNTGNLKRTGYTWGGWSLNQDGSGTVYGPDTADHKTYTITNQSVNFYPVWQKIAIPASGSITITGDDFTNSYDSGNTKSHQTLVEEDGAIVTWESINVMKNSGVQFKASGGNLYNTVSLGNITSIEISGTTALTVYYGTAAGSCTSTSVGSGNGFFKIIKEGSGAAVATSIVITWAPARTITSSRLTGSVSIETEDTAWDTSKVKLEVKYDDDVNWTDVTGSATITVPSGLPTITETVTTTVNVKAVFSTVDITVALTAYIRYVPQYSIERVYWYEVASGKTTSDSYTVDGIYMGTVANKSYIFMNGEYGVMAYTDAALDPAPTVGNYYTISGCVKNFNGLYEIVSASVSALTTPQSRIDEVGSPVTYVVDGSEESDDAYLASRKTSLTGIVTGSAVATSGRSNTAITVNGTAITVTIASSTEDIAAAFNASKTNEEPITIEGFSSFYNGFQVGFTNIVSADPNYHAADFARNLLKLTKSYCNSSYDGVTDQKASLTTVWTTLAGASHWLKVQANGEGNTLKLGTPDKTIEVPATDVLIDAMSDADAIAAALYRYDYCTAKYELTNFIERTLTVSFGFGSIPFAFNANETNKSATFIAIIAVISTLSVGGFFFLKKRKEQ